MRNLESNRRRAGYSLMELLVVLVLIGILATLAGPAMGEYVGRQKTRRALDRIAGDLALARMMAVRSGEGAVVRFAGAADYQVVLPVSADTVRRARLGVDYPGVVVAPPGGDIEFNSRGLLGTGSGTGYLVVSLAERRDSLMITPTGRVYRDY